MTGVSMQVLFQYFFTVGAGLGLGLLATIGSGYVIAKKVGGMNLWRSKRK